MKNQGESKEEEESLKKLELKSNLNVICQKGDSLYYG